MYCECIVAAQQWRTTVWGCITDLTSITLFECFAETARPELKSHFKKIRQFGPYRLDESNGRAALLWIIGAPPKALVCFLPRLRVFADNL